MEWVSCHEHFFNLVASYRRRPHNVRISSLAQKPIRSCSSGVLFASIRMFNRLLLICEVPKSRGWCLGGETKHRKCNIELNYLQRSRCMPRVEKAHLPRLEKLSRVYHSAWNFLFLQLHFQTVSSKCLQGKQQVLTPSLPSIYLYQVSPQSMSTFLTAEDMSSINVSFEKTGVVSLAYTKSAAMLMDSRYVRVQRFLHLNDISTSSSSSVVEASSLLFLIEDVSICASGSFSNLSARALGSGSLQLHNNPYVFVWIVQEHIFEILSLDFLYRLFRQQSQLQIL